MLAAANKEANAAEIPQEVDEVDPSEEVRRVIDEVLGGEHAAEE